jgi:hypothetical protein
MRWLVVLVAVACSKRPIPIPEAARADLGHLPDLAPPMCGGDCDCLGHPCTLPSDCCSFVCDQSTYTCAVVESLPDLARSCNGPGDCALSGCPCTSFSDCCVGLACLVPVGAVQGTCGNAPRPDMACIEGVLAGGVCTTTADCCGQGLFCMVPAGSAKGTCTQDCACSLCGDLCFPAGHCCRTNFDCCSFSCQTAADGSSRCS